MNEVEERRRELLRQTRCLYENNQIPAVHPRFGHVYHELYSEDEQERIRGTFFLRLFLTVLCFICYVWIDYGKITVAYVNSDQIVTQIERQLKLKDVEEVWRNL